MESRPLFVLTFKSLLEQYAFRNQTAYMKPVLPGPGLMVLRGNELELYSPKTRLTDICLCGAHAIKAVNKIESGSTTLVYITLVAGQDAGAPSAEAYKAVAAYALGLKDRRFCGLYPTQGETYTAVAGSDAREIVMVDEVRDSVRVEIGNDVVLVLLDSRGPFALLESVDRIAVSAPVIVEGETDFAQVESIQRPLVLSSGEPFSVLNGETPIAVRFGFDGETLKIEVLDSDPFKEGVTYVGALESDPSQFAQFVGGKLVLSSNRKASISLTRQLQCGTGHH